MNTIGVKPKTLAQNILPKAATLLFYLLLLFTVVPLTEFVLLSRLSDLVGLPATIGLVLVTGAIGAALARQQGLATLARVQGQMGAGQMPGDALFDGALILVAGAVLITPGMLTDAVGFSLLIPPVRSVIKRLLKRHFAGSVRFHVNGVQVNGDPTRGFSAPASGPTQADDDVVEGEVIHSRVIDDP